jgi:hypothetical protein
MLQKLPLGLSTFSRIRKEGCLYVDKTEGVYKLISQGYRYFLSRPRRFGKSLFISTLDEILRGSKGLFNDLWISSSNYPWHEHGIIKIDLSKIEVVTPDDLRTGICLLLNEISSDYKLDIEVSTNKVDAALRSVVRALHARFGRVALLIDEYDHPILKSLQNQEHARNIRNALQAFFAAVKGLDEYINFVFITGVSSFAKAGLFSGMNNLQVMTPSDTWATLCGYTEDEVDHYFKDYIQAWADKDGISYEEQRNNLKRWYNGYHFGENSSAVYNPFSLMNALHSKKYDNFWFESGNPLFLIDVLKEKYASGELQTFDTITTPAKFEITKDTLGIFDVGATPIVALMFQTGYLTIVDYDRARNTYRLDYPNNEVKTALQKYLIGIFAHLDSSVAEHVSLQLYTACMQQDIDQIITLLKQLFASIPYQLHIPEEKFYHALLHSICIIAGIPAQSEYSTSNARIDLVLDLPNIIYIIEVKFNIAPEKALAQIEERSSHQALLHHNKPIMLLGLSFERTAKKFDIKGVSKKIPLP